VREVGTRTEPAVKRFSVGGFVVIVPVIVVLHGFFLAPRALTISGVIFFVGHVALSPNRLVMKW
jgi:hypothetical protein